MHLRYRPDRINSSHPSRNIAHSLTTAHCSSGRSGLRPSLVQGLRPRNAPLQNHPSPTSHSFPTEVPDPAAPFKARAAAKRHQSLARPPANLPAHPSTRANHSPSRKSPKSQFRQIPPSFRPRACPHPIPRIPSIPGQTTRQSPRQPSTRANHSPSRKSPKSQFRQIPPSFRPRAHPSSHPWNPINPHPDHPPIPPPTPARAQITVHHENPPNHSSDNSPLASGPVPALIPSLESHQSPSRPPANHPANPRTRANHSPSRKSPKSQFRQNPPIPPPTPARAQITVHHENPPNHSSDRTRQSPRQPPHARKSQPITKIPQITVQTNPPNHSSDQANCIKNRDIIALCRNTNRHCLERFVIKHDPRWLGI